MKYKIVKAQLPIVGSMAGHNFVVLMDENNHVIREMHGLAHSKEKNGEYKVKPIGYLPSDRLRFVEYNYSKYYQANFPQQVVYEGSYAEVMEKWNIGVEIGKYLNEKDLYYPIGGLIDVHPPLNGAENSNSMASTLLHGMGLSDPDLGMRLTPGEGKKLLTEEEFNRYQKKDTQSIQEHKKSESYLVNPPNQFLRGEDKSFQNLNQDFVSQGFAALLSDNPQQGINQMLNSDYAKTFDVQAQQVLAQDEAAMRQETAQNQELNKLKMVRG